VLIKRNIREWQDKAMSHINKLLAGFELFGINLRKFIYSFRGIIPFFRGFLELRRQARLSDNNFSFGMMYPCLTDIYEESGVAKGHYFHQDIIVARKIFLNVPERHIDVGSRIDGFVAHVAAFREIEVLDRGICLRQRLSN